MTSKEVVYMYFLPASSFYFEPVNHLCLQLCTQQSMGVEVFIKIPFKQQSVHDPVFMATHW